MDNESRPHERLGRLGRMRVEYVLERLGGVADTGTLVRLTSRGRVRRAVRDGRVVRDARGRYALRSADEALRAANRLCAVVSHESAAAYWGWELKRPPGNPVVTVPRNRNLSPGRRAGVKVKWARLSPDDVVHGHVTSPGRTVMDCAVTLPFDEALAIADSALRHGAATKAGLVALAEGIPSRYRRRAMRVAEAADGRAANPFESVLRAVALGVPGLTLVPQTVIREDGLVARPDLVDLERRVVVEADSFEWHGSRKALRRDCARYNALVLRGWTVLRFAWEHVMHDPDYVADCLRRLVEVPVQRALEPEPDQLTA